MNIEPYLVELDQEREKIAMRRAFTVDFILDPLLFDLGLSSRLYWAILELPNSVIVNEKDSTEGLGGEIDSLLGTLTVNEKGQLIWPPHECQLAAIEAKAGYLSIKDEAFRFSSSKGGPGKRKNIEKELKRLVQLGIDRITFLDIVATPPSSSELDGQAWLQAAEAGRIAIETARPILSDRPLPYPFIGHWALGWGSVEGGPEHWRGAPGLNCLRHCDQNMKLDEQHIACRRKAVQNRVSELLSAFPPPSTGPYIARYCQPCLSLHRLYFGGAQDPCLKESR